LLAVRYQSIEQTRISGVIEKTPKTKKSRRLIALADIALSALKALRKEQSEQKLRLDPLYQDKGYLFANDAGALWKPEAFTKAFQRLVKKNRYRTRSLSRSQALSR
jgi:integrase